MAIDIITRFEWGAQKPKSVLRRINTPTDEVWLHHSVTAGFGPDAMRKLQLIAFGRGFDDVSYSYAVDQLGYIYEGRGHGIEGAHTLGHNSISHGVVAIGNFDVDKPTDALINSLAGLIRHGSDLGWWKFPRYSGGHRDVANAATACPGKNLYAQIKEINRKASYSPPPAPAPQPVPPQHFPGDKMTRHELHVGGLDGQGNGWVPLPGIDYNKVVSIYCHGSYPPTDGYWPIPKFACQERGQDTIVEITGGVANQGGFNFIMWVAD